jgi:hypothetical protein
MAFIEWLGATNAPADDWDGLLGGKGASLERLLRMGAPTPPGFCLTTRAFRHHLEIGAPNGEIAAAIQALPDPAAREILLRQLIEEPLAAPLGPDLEAGVERLAATNGGAEARFAVRSSAIGEDGRTASFAGIHETELELSAAEVPAAVRRCWASVWSDRALQYRALKQLPMDGSMAVVVQVLVPADAAAVVFTATVTQRGDQILVNAVRGSAVARPGMVRSGRDRPRQGEQRWEPDPRRRRPRPDGRPAPRAGGAIGPPRGAVREADRHRGGALRRALVHPAGPADHRLMSDAPAKAPILPPGPEGFAFAWRVPEDAELSWEWDSMHFPSPLTPLAGDYAGRSLGFEYRHSGWAWMEIWDGSGTHAYFAARFGIPESEARPRWRA